MSAEQADESIDDDPTGDPDYVPNPSYDLPDGVSSWNEWMDA